MNILTVETPWEDQIDIDLSKADIISFEDLTTEPDETDDPKFVEAVKDKVLIGVHIKFSGGNTFSFSIYRPADVIQDVIDDLRVDIERCVTKRIPLEIFSHSDLWDLED